MNLDLDLQHVAPPPRRKDYRIGVIGSGFIVRDCHLVSYRNAGYNVAAITSTLPDQAREVAAARGIPKVYATTRELLEDDSIEVLDIAVPPHALLSVMREVAEHGRHVKGILSQKPMGTSFAEAKEIVGLAGQAGIVLGVNQNMRYDHSIRALKTVLDRGYLGEPVLGTIEMRATPHWKPWVRQYGRVTLQIMSIHHLDAFRYLFGDPDTVYCSARKDPRTQFEHRDGIVLYVLEYANGMRAAAWDDVWTGPAREGSASDIYIKWRVEGTGGLARGTIGWPSYPNTTPSTIDFTTKLAGNTWFSPRWKEAWFPDAFQGTMGQLLDALATGTEPAVSGRDNLKTIALIDACYKSIDEHRPVAISETLL